jgi:enolase
MIKDIRLTWIYNSAKQKTIKVFLKTDKGMFVASNPSGKSKGKYEAKPLDIKIIFKNFPEIKKKFIGKNEKNIDRIIEKIGIEEMGSNLSIALSIAAIKSISNNQPHMFLNPVERGIPYPLGNVSGAWIKNSIQEFLVAPLKAKTITDAIETNKKIWKDVGKRLKSKKKNREGGWISPFDDIKTFDIISKITEENEAVLGIDIAASGLYKDGKYYYKNLNKKLDSKDQLEFVRDLIKTYKLFYVEDPFHEEDFKSFSELTKKVKCLIVGDDLFATNEQRLELGVEQDSANAIIIKPNQAGTVSRALKTVSEAIKAKYTTIVSHRSADTLDTFISDLAVGIESPLLKCGIYGKERSIKLKRLIEIWDSLENPVMNKPKVFI